MAAQALLYTGAIITLAWGIAYGISMRRITAGYQGIPVPDRRILTMSWMTGASLLAFIGLLDILVTYYGDPASGSAYVTYICSGGMLIFLSALTLVTTGRSPRTAIRIFPYITAFSALLLIAGAVR